jgi:hypothetical protein
MRVKAIDSFSYANKPYIIGDEFDMPDRDAKLLSECISPRVVVLETKAEPPPSAKLETVEMKAEEPAAQESAVQESAHEEAEPADQKARSARSRRYMRRDMTPQE